MEIVLINKQEDCFATLMQSLIFQNGRISSIARMSTLERLINLAKNKAELKQLEPVIRRLKVVKKSRVKKKVTKVSHLPAEIDRIVKIFEDKKNDIKVEEISLDFNQVNCISKNIHEFIWNFFYIEKAFRGNFLNASSEIQFSFQEWRKGYIATRGRSRVLKKFFEKKMEQSAQSPCDYIYLYGVISDRREEFIQKIKSFDFSWDEIAGRCREDSCLRNEIGVNELLETIRSRL